MHFAVALNRANLIKCLLDKVDENIESYAGKLAFEIGENIDDDEDEEDEDEIVCKQHITLFFINTTNFKMFYCSMTILWNQWMDFSYRIIVLSGVEEHIFEH